MAHGEYRRRRPKVVAVITYGVLRRVQVPFGTVFFAGSDREDGSTEGQGQPSHFRDKLGRDHVESEQRKVSAPPVKVHVP